MLDPRNVPAERRTQDGPQGRPGRRAAVLAGGPPRTAAALAGALVAGGVLLVLALVLHGAVGEPWSTLLVDAGCALVVVGVLGLLLESGLARLRDDDRIGSARADARQGPGPAGAYGFAGVREELDFVDVLKSVAPGQELWWMDTFPLTLAGDLDALHKALATGVRVRLLVLDPKSPAMTARLREVRRHYGLSPMDLRRGFDTLCNQLKVLGRADPVVAEHLELRAYDGLPGAPMFLVLRAAEQDGERAAGVVRAFSSWYLLDASQDMPYLEWEDGELTDRLRAYFEHKWAEGHVIFPVEAIDRTNTVVPLAGSHAPRRAGGERAGT